MSDHHEQRTFPADGEPRVTITVADHVADVRLARADKMNALDPAMFAAIAAAQAWLAEQAAVRAVVLSGEGQAFCAGLDLASMAFGEVRDITERTHGLANIWQNAAWGWRALPMPVIAAAQGVAFGGGFQILSGADIRFAHPATRMAIMEAKWGIVPDMAGYALWRGCVRDDVVRELAYTAREFTAEEGARLGFVTHLSDDPHAAAMDLAHSIAGRNPHAVRAMKRLSAIAADGDPAAILSTESIEQAALLRSPNQMEAVAAGMAKRAPVFGD